jgi:hypothetical protein
MSSTFYLLEYSFDARISEYGIVLYFYLTYLDT